SLVCLASRFAADARNAAAPPDPSQLRELLHDRLHPRQQSQAALLLVQNHSKEAEEIVREALQQTESIEVFQALAAALRLSRDNRFGNELLAALAASSTSVRQSAADTLAVLADPAILLRLQALVEDPQAELAARQAALETLGHTGRKEAAIVLLDQLSGSEEPLRRTAADALAHLTGQSHGLDAVRWRAWWNGHKDLPAERWLEGLPAYQASHAARLEGELERTRTQVVQLHQKLYARLPPADRLGFVRDLVESEDANVRVLAVTWSAELLVSADNVGQRQLGDTLLRLA